LEEITDETIVLLAFVSTAAALTTLSEIVLAPSRPGKGEAMGLAEGPEADEVGLAKGPETGEIEEMYNPEAEWPSLRGN
jgi:hypothetical protein